MTIFVARRIKRCILISMTTTTNTKATETETQNRRARWNEEMEREDAFFATLEAELAEEQGW